MGARQAEAGERLEAVLFDPVDLLLPRLQQRYRKWGSSPVPNPCQVRVAAFDHTVHVPACVFVCASSSCCCVCPYLAAYHDVSRRLGVCTPRFVVRYFIEVFYPLLASVSSQNLKCLRGGAPCFCDRFFFFSSFLAAPPPSERSWRPRIPGRRRWSRRRRR